MDAQFMLLGGSLTKTPVHFDAIMTLVNSGCFFYGQIDNAIMTEVGPWLHQKVEDVAKEHQLVDGEVIIARTEAPLPSVTFGAVVFIVDDLKLPLETLVYKGLVAARNGGIKSVAMPIFRNGNMRGLRESPEEIVRAMHGAISKFVQESQTDMKIAVVIYDPDTLKFFGETVKLIE